MYGACLGTNDDDQKRDDEIRNIYEKYTPRFPNSIFDYNRLGAIKVPFKKIMNKIWIARFSSVNTFYERRPIPEAIDIKDYATQEYLEFLTTSASAFPF